MKFYKTFLLFAILLGFLSCSNNEETPKDVEINAFIWKGLNAYYLWRENVTDLSDRRFSSEQQLYNYLSDFNDPNKMFDHLLYQKKIKDKWSWIVDDYIALEESFQGITQTTGMEYGLVKYRGGASNLFGYVRYVVPGTDAASKGITRGMIFNKVNGIQLTNHNYRSLLFSEDPSFTITLSNYNSGNPTATDNFITLEKNRYTENPIHIFKTLEIDGHRIGYLMYNGFSSNFDNQLNQVFAQFKSEGVTELIVDLRYNNGGSVRSATRLASMITGQFTGEVFAKQLWNQKYMSIVKPEYLIDRFTSEVDNNIPINNLNLTKVYFITTANSASASELIINCLDPYISVHTVGTKTRGKYVGSITLYDSPNFYSKKNINPHHNWAMQPVVFESVNSNNKNQKDGIFPSIEMPENYGNLGDLGTENEPLLKRTIRLITNKLGSTKNSNLPSEYEVVGDSKSNTPTYNNMYITLNE